uniref:Semaphorin-4A n=1 Tax=Steinernema glaseri TaxID=37863 RepID=A0A1I7YSG9_9BILA
MAAPRSPEGDRHSTYWVCILYPTVVVAIARLLDEQMPPSRLLLLLTLLAATTAHRGRRGPEPRPSFSNLNLRPRQTIDAASVAHRFRGSPKSGSDHFKLLVTDGESLLLGASQGG